MLGAAKAVQTSSSGIDTFVYENFTAGSVTHQFGKGVWAEGIYVIPGTQRTSGSFDNGELYSTSNPVAGWTERTPPDSTTTVATGIAHDGTTFVGVGSDFTSGTQHYIIYSNNGTTSWSYPTTVAAGESTAALNSVAYGNGVWFAYGYKFTSSAFGYTSTAPTTTWTRNDPNKTMDATISHVKFMNSLFIAVGDEVIYTSDPTGGWTYGTSPPVTFTDIAWNDGLALYVGVGGNSIYSSPDLTTWTIRKTGLTARYSVEWVPALSRFIAGGNGFLYQSFNGTTWTAYSFTDTDSINALSMIYGGNNTLIISTDRGIAYSLP